MKQKKGISLIVFVITIIIMIIISGAIILTLTETNIIEQAETAVNKYNETELKQRVGLVFTEAQMAKYTDLEYSIEDNLKSIFEGIYGKDNITVAKSGKNYKLNVNDSKTTFRIKPDGSIQEYEEMDPTDVYARLDDQGMLYLRATEKEGYNLYNNNTSIQVDWNTAGNATPASVIKVIIEEEIAPTTTSSMFAGMINLETIENMQNLRTENVKSMSYMFERCSKLSNIEISNFDTHKVTNMNRMFFGCSNLESLDLSDFNTSNVVNFEDMFNSCKKITIIDVSSFNTAKATNVIRMFFGCEKLEYINVNSFDTSNVTSLDNMFGHCYSLTKIDLSNFNTHKVKNTAYLFLECKSLTDINISKFDTINVTKMKEMFYNCISLKNIKLGNSFAINDGIDLTNILYNAPSDIKITTTEATRDKLISVSSLTEDNFEIIK